MSLFLYIVVMYAISAILVYFDGPDDIILKFRDYLEESGFNSLFKLFSCMMCMPVNLGFVMSLINIAFIPDIDLTPMHYLIEYSPYMAPLVILLDGFFTGGAVYLIDTVQSMLERIGNYNKTDNKKELLYE